MPKNEDGEFELILGNRQLLSVFFIVVVLLGVFFTMGYIVGRNSAPAPDVAATRTSKPLLVDAPSSPAQRGDSPSEAPPSSPPAPSQPASTEPQAPVTTAQQAPPEPAHSEPARVPAKKEVERPLKPLPASVTQSEPAAGQSFLQLAATSKREADIMVDVLREKGFKAMAAEIPEKRGTFRVLVGPVTDATANKTRADLQSGGFPGDRAIRRTF